MSAVLKYINPLLWFNWRIGGNMDSSSISLLGQCVIAIYGFLLLGVLITHLIPAIVDWLYGNK